MIDLNMDKIGTHLNIGVIISVDEWRKSLTQLAQAHISDNDIEILIRNVEVDLYTRFENATK